MRAIADAGFFLDLKNIQAGAMGFLRFLCGVHIGVGGSSWFTFLLYSAFRFFVLGIFFCLTERHFEGIGFCIFSRLQRIQVDLEPQSILFCLGVSVVCFLVCECSRTPCVLLLFGPGSLVAGMLREGCFKPLFLWQLQRKPTEIQQP